MTTALVTFIAHNLFFGIAGPSHLPRRRAVARLEG
jgi:hypothetical protein